MSSTSSNSVLSNMGEEGDTNVTAVILWVVVVVLFFVFVGMLIKQLHSAQEEWTYGEVYELDETGLERMIASGKQTSVMFYAPWCPHCRQMKPLYREAAKTQKDTLFAMVDCDKNPSCAKKHNIRAFPACNMYREGSKIGGFVGGRPDVASIKKEIKSACAR